VKGKLVLKTKQNKKNKTRGEKKKSEEKTLPTNPTVNNNNKTWRGAARWSAGRGGD